MTTSIWHVFSRDASGAITGKIDGFTRLEIIPRFNAVGSWAMDIDLSLDQAALLGIGGGISIYRDGQPFFSGKVGGYERSRDAVKNSISWYGKCDLGFLEKRVALPVVSGPPYSSATHDVRTGVAETVLKQYVYYNAGAGANLARRVTGLTIETDYGRGSAVTGRARFDGLMDLLAMLAGAASPALGFRVVDLQFQVYSPVDRTSSILFDFDTGTLLSYQYQEGEPDANYLITGGLGTGTSRTFVEGMDSNSVLRWGRAEEFYNYERTSVTAELLEMTASELDNRGSSSSLKVVPIEAKGRCMFVDYTIGDLVAFRIDGVELSMRLTEARIVISQDAVVITPVLSAGNIPVGLQRDALRNAQARKRIGVVERS